MNGESRKRIAKLLTSGPTVLDPLWNPQTSGQIYQIVAEGLGSVYVAGGFFPLAGGGWTASIAKLSATGMGEADPLWKPFNDRTARRFAVNTVNAALFAVSRTYDETTGMDTYYLTKHSTNGVGEADPSWNPTINGPVERIDVVADKVLLGGWFNRVSGQVRHGLAALPINAPEAIFANSFESAPIQ